MKVLLFNGSPHPHGCTYTALSEVAKALEAAGIATEILQSGTKPVQDCIACGGCRGQNRCVFNDDCVNEWIAKAQTADGFIFGTPVYYAHPSGRIMSALDRVFYAAGKTFAHKPAAVVAVARRAGTTATIDALSKHCTVSQMPLVSSTYWNLAYGGNDPAAMAQDLEGLQTMRNLGRNMAWLLKCLDAGQQAGITPPPTEPITRTGFHH